MIDFWSKGVMEGYALDFLVECHYSLTTTLELSKGSYRRIIEETLVWIKILLAERSIGVGVLIPACTKRDLLRVCGL